MISDQSIGEYEEAYAGPPAPDDMDPEAQDRAAEVMAAFSGVGLQHDITGRRIRPGDWIARAASQGRYGCEMRFARAFPAEQLTKARQERLAAGKTVQPHIVLYEPTSNRATKDKIRKTTLDDGAKSIIIDRAIVPRTIRETLDGERPSLDAQIQDQRDRTKKYYASLKEAIAAGKAKALAAKAN